MAKNRHQTASPSGAGSVKTETLIIVALVALAIGFVGGVAFGVYRAGRTDMPGPRPTTAPPAEDGQKLAALQDEAARHPDDPETWTRLGHYFFDQGDSAAAIGAYEKSLALRPEDPNVLTDLGVMYRRNGDPKGAAAIFDRALAVDGHHEIALFNKGIVLLHDLQDIPGALESWQRLLAINPSARTPSGQPLADLVDHVKTHQTDGPTGD